ncbi:MAG: glycosyltransferase family 4 protein [Bacteroidota bacterium]
MGQRKILIITNRVPYPLKDGGNIAMNAMIDGYHRSGWQVYLLAMNTSRHHVKSEQLDKLYGHLHAFEAFSYDNDLKWMDIAKNFILSSQPEHAKRFYSTEFKEKIKDALAIFKPDVVQVESVFLTTYLGAIKKYSHAVTVLRMHNIEYQIWQGLARRTKNYFKKLYLNSLAVRVRNYERAAWKQYDMLLPITEKDAYLVQRLEQVEDIVVAPFSINMDDIKPPTGNERWVGYHLGAMDWLPNQQGVKWFISKAWPLIHRALPKFEFYFAGRKMPAEFSKMADDGLYCMNEVEDADEFISDKKILIVPVLSGGGIRVKILEAMAAGKIIITTSTGIKGIEAKPEEHYLRAHHPEDFLKAIKWCLENKQAADAMAKNAQSLVTEKYEHRKVIQRVTDAIEDRLAMRE